MEQNHNTFFLLSNLRLHVNMATVKKLYSIILTIVIIIIHTIIIDA